MPSAVTRPAQWSIPLAVLAAIITFALVDTALLSLKVALLVIAASTIAVAVLIIGADLTGGALIVLGFITLPFDAVHTIGSIKIADVFLLPAFVLLIPRLTRRAPKLPLTFTIGALGLLVSATLSALVTDPRNLSTLAHMLLSIWLLPLLLFRWQPGNRAVIVACSGYMLGTVINVVAALIDGPTAGNGRYLGLSSAVNVMGTCGMISIALAPFLLARVSRKAAWLVVAGAVISAYAVWISGSRLALMGAIIVALVYPLLGRSVKGAMVLVALCIPALTYIGDRSAQNTGASNAFSRLLGNESAAGSDAARAAGQQYGLHWVASHPLTGGGDWHIVWGVHNTYLQIAAGFGLFALMFYVVLLSPFLRPLVAVRTPFNLLGLPPLLVALTGVVDPALAAQFSWCVVAFALSASRLAAQSQTDTLDGGSPPATRPSDRRDKDPLAANLLAQT